MKYLASACQVLGYVWLIGATILILVGYAGVLLTEGLFATLELMSPFNVANFIAVVVTLAPGVALVFLSQKLRERIA
jgi:hypothetical protein